MASNPMQRKANMYLLIGVFVTLLITGSIIGILIMQHVKLKNEIDAEHQSMQTVYVTSKDIKSGDEVKTSDINTAVKVSKTAVPSNYITDVDSRINCNFRYGLQRRRRNYSRYKNTRI